jgi:hypothetical protein
MTSAFEGFTVDPNLDSPRAVLPKSRRRTARPVTEAAVKTGVLARLNLGGYAITKHQTSYGKRGTPDVLACRKGRFVAIEVKRPGKTPDPDQLGEMRRWQEAGALVGWVQSVAHLEQLLDHLDDPSWRNNFKHPGDGREADDKW